MRVGFLSVAHIHADAYVHNVRAAGADVAGVYDHDTARGTAWAERYGVPWYASVQELFAAGIDAAAVCGETAFNRPLVEAAAAAGIPVLCEKPLATTLQDAAAAVAACERAGVALMAAHPMRFSPPVLEARTMVAEGALGELYACTGTNQAELPTRHAAWFADPGLSGGGAVMDHTVHLADLLRWFLGREPEEVYAATNRVLHRDEVAVETGALLSLRYGGVVATIDASWSRPAEYPTWGGLTMELVGEHGVVAVDPFSQHLTVHGGANGPLDWPPWGGNANQAMVAEFLACVCEGRPPAVTGEDGLAATRVALAAYRSASRGQPVPLDPAAD